MGSASPAPATLLADQRVLTRADLLAIGMRPRQITEAVRSGTLTRLRRDRYVTTTVDDGSDAAVRVGGRLTCISAVATTGAFVMKDSRTHIHVDREMSRLRSPHSHLRVKRWVRGRDDRSARLHWGRLREPVDSRHVVSLFDALITMIRCQPARSVVATLDSLLFLGILTMDDLRSVFGELPARYAVLLRLVDARSESGPESLMRLILRQLGLRFEVQAEIDGVGRVDFLVEGRLIIECDSRAFHEGWLQQKHDRRRDLAAASRGLMTLRPLAEDIMYHPETVVPAIRELLAVHAHCGV